MRELESSFDDSTSAMEKNRKKSQLLNKQIESQEKLVSKLEDGLKAAEEAYGKDAAETQKWRQAVNNAKTDLNKMNAELKKIPSSLTTVGTEMQNVGKKMQDIGGTLTKYVTVPLTAMAAASVASFNEVDEGLDIVTKKTGATGQALAELQQSAINIAETIPTSFETAGEAVGEVNTRFGLTGTALEELSTQFIEFAELNDTSVSSSIDNVQKLMAAYGVEAEDAGKVLDVLNKTGQDTGISMETLMSSMTKNAASMQEMGLNAYDAAQFLGQVETSGADTSVVMSGLQKALTNAAKAGKSLPEALKDFQKVMSSSASDQEKLNAAIDLFGKKAGPAIYNACKTGSLSFESLSSDASTYLGNVKTTFENTLDPADDFKVAMNKAKVAGSKLGGALLDVAVPAIETAGELAEKAGKWFDGLTDSQKHLVSYAGFFALGMGPVLSVLGAVAEAAGTVVAGIGSISGAAGLGTLTTVAGPIGAAAGAFALLATGIHNAHENALDSVEGLRGMLSDTATSTKELNDAVEKVQKTIDGTNKNIDDINSKAAVADKLIEELYKLDSASNKTAEDQARMKVIVGELNSLYPGLELAIDGATGALNKGKEEVSAYVEETKKLALAEAYATGIKNAYNDLADAQMKLKAAQDAQAEALDVYTRAYHDLQVAEENAVKDVQTGLPVYTDEMNELADAVDTARTALENQNGVVRENKKAVSEAEQTVGEWEDAYDDLTDTSKKATKATKDQTNATENQTDANGDLAESSEDAEDAIDSQADATDDLSDAADDAASSLNNLTMKERLEQLAAKATLAALLPATTALGKAASAAKQAGESYQQSANDMSGAITKQIGLFDKFEKRADVNIETLKANAESRRKAISDYAENLDKLVKWAEESGSQSAKDYVAAIAEMGMGAAEEVAVLANSANEDLTWLAEQNYEATVSATFASENAAKAMNGFMTEEEKKFATFAENISGSINTKLGDNNIWNDFKANSKSAIDGQKTYWSNNSPEAEVKVSIPDSKTLFGKKNDIQKGIGTPNTSVSVSTPDNKTLLTKKQAIAKAFAGLSATVSIKTSGASDAGRAAARSIKNAAGTVYIPVAASRTGSAARPYATGGFVDEPTYSLVGEAGPEVIIPLSSNMRARALDLFQQAGETLGVQTVTMPTAPTARIPDRSSSGSGSSALNIDFSQLYDAVASAARAGMQSADIKVYWNNREAGRIMKNMGVQFA